MCHVNVTISLSEERAFSENLRTHLKVATKWQLDGWWEHSRAAKHTHTHTHRGVARPTDNSYMYRNPVVFSSTYNTVTERKAYPTIQAEG